MNILLWILQVVLAFFSVSGGAFKIFKIDALAGAPFFSALPRAGWGALGVFEMIAGVLLVVPLAAGWMPALTPLAAAALAVESFALAALYGWYSRQLSAENPLVWVVVIGVLATFVAWGRFANGTTN